MTNYLFRIRLRDPLTDEDVDRIYDKLFDEVAVEEGPKGNFVCFERDAASFLDAVLDALKEVITLDLEPLSVEDELVSMTDIAERTGRSRQSVSMLVGGQRGRGGFPRPVAGNVRSPLWHWADVASWFTGDAGREAPSEDRVQVIAAINGELAERILARERPKDLKRIQRLAG